MLQLPVKIKGLFLRCIRCKWQITKKKKICHLTGKKLSSCPHTNLHRYEMQICVPGQPGKRISRILDAGTSFEEAQIEVKRFRQELQANNYLPKRVLENTQAVTFVDFVVEYLDSLSGVNTPQFLTRKRSDEYVNECRLCIERFTIALKKKGYPIKALRLDEITDTEVGIFHDYLHEMKFSQRNYNKHIGALKCFISWCIRVKDQPVKNAFNHVELRTVTREPSIITKREFERLLQITTAENGKYKDAVKARSLYKPYLKHGFLLALETGLRREELVSIRWSDIIEMEPGVFVIRLNNLKVNRIMNGIDSGRVKFAPVTKSLKKLLDELGYEEKRATTGYILERPANMDVRYLMDSLSRGFGHYIKLASDRKLDFKCLRKTYLSKMVLVLGDKTKYFSGHSANSEVLKNHYVSSAFLAGSLNDFEVF